MAEDWQVVNAKDEKVHQSCNARPIDVVLASEVALQGGQASLIPEWSYVKGAVCIRPSNKAQVITLPVQNTKPLVANTC